MILPGGPAAPWPSRRSFHAACSLVDPNCCQVRHSATVKPPSSVLERKHSWLPFLAPDLSMSVKSLDEACVDPKLLVLWGMDNNGDPVNDVWILNVNTLTWKKVRIIRMYIQRPTVLIFIVVATF